jgi:hypothetical protein
MIDGRTLDRITKDQITTAANTADDDDAIRVLQDIAGITDGGIAGQCFSGFEWATSEPSERFARIVFWLHAEKIHFQADALEEIERLAEAAAPIPTFAGTDARDGQDDWGSERQIDAQNEFTQALENYLPPSAWAKFEASLDKASTEDIIRNGLEIARATFA